MGGQGARLRLLGELGHVAAISRHTANARFVQASRRRFSTGCAIVRGNAQVNNKAM